MQNVQTANFIREFLIEASHFGLHLDTENNTGPFKSVEGMTVAKVLDLKESYLFVLSAGFAILVYGAGTTGANFPLRWVSARPVQTVEELHHTIKLRREVQAARWN
jgi:hypothetical protein